MHASRTSSIVRALSLGWMSALVATGCGSFAPADDESVGQVRQEVTAPLASAYCTVQVDGIGSIDTEQNYLPHVVQCENGGADLQALKAQAIAARSVVYYNMATQGSICDGQGCQVYSCGSTPSAIHHQAVDETSGMYLSYDDMLTYGFYVAGDNNTSPPNCVGSSGTTEHWITYNEGKTGADVEQTELGYVSYPIFGQNRGCMGQWGARCLEANKGYDHLAILRFYYGADIQILTAPGSCVTPTTPDLDAAFVASGSDADSSPAGNYQVCAGSSFHFWFEVENTGAADWVDVSGSSVGTAVRLGVPGDATDPLVGANRISLGENANDNVDPSGGDCSDAPGCRRTRFIGGEGIAATAPATPGFVTTTWQLVDEGRSWFGPQLSLTFDVVECESGTGGAGGSGGSSGTGGGTSGSGGSAGTPGDGGSAGTWPSTDGGAGSGGSDGYYYAADEPDGCACRMTGRATSPPWLAALVGLMLLRRRKTQCRPRRDPV